VVYKLTPNSDGTWTESVLWSFMGPPDGQRPTSDLMFDASGNLDGTASQGGSLEKPCATSASPFGCGVVFQLSANPDGTWKETILHTFDGADGFGPQYGLISDSTGSLYGTTEWGDVLSDSFYFAGCGNVFKLTQSADGWTETVLHNFSGYGQDPGPLLLDLSGGLFGTAFTGTTTHGLVFEITP
jgi:hypothetical protein